MVSVAERVNFFYLLNFNSFIFKLKQSQWLALNVVDSTASDSHYSMCPWARSTGPYQKCRLSGPTPDLLYQNLHCNMIPR